MNLFEDESFDQQIDEKEEKGDLEKQTHVMAPSLMVGASGYVSNELNSLKKDESGSLRMFRIVEERETDNHAEFLDIPEDMVVVRSQPVSGRPFLCRIVLFKSKITQKTGIAVDIMKV